MGLRYSVLCTIAKEVGNNVSIHEGVYLFSPAQLKIGSNVSIHPMCTIDAKGGITIGNDVSIAHAASLISFDHVFSDRNVPIKDQGTVGGKIYIQDNVWIGAKATILKNVIVHSGAIIAAGAVVTKNVRCNVIVAGIPAKEIRER